MVHCSSSVHAVVFAVATALVLATLVPAAFLPKKPAQPAPGQPSIPVLTH